MMTGPSNPVAGVLRRRATTRNINYNERELERKNSGRVKGTRFKKKVKIEDAGRGEGGDEEDDEDGFWTTGSRYGVGTASASKGDIDCQEVDGEDEEVKLRQPAFTFPHNIPDIPTPYADMIPQEAQVTGRMEWDPVPSYHYSNRLHSLNKPDPTIPFKTYRYAGLIEQEVKAFDSTLQFNNSNTPLMSPPAGYPIFFVDRHGQIGNTPLPRWPNVETVTDCFHHHVNQIHWFHQAIWPWFKANSKREADHWGFMRINFDWTTPYIRTSPLEFEGNSIIPTAQSSTGEPLFHATLIPAWAYEPATLSRFLRRIRDCGIHDLGLYRDDWRAYWLLTSFEIRNEIRFFHPNPWFTHQLDQFPQVDYEEELDRYRNVYLNHYRMWLEQRRIAQAIHQGYLKIEEEQVKGVNYWCLDNPEVEAATDEELAAEGWTRMMLD